MRLVSSRVVDASPNCLDEECIAALADGREQVAGSPLVFAHLVECARCRNEVASVARLLETPEVATEVDRLERPHQGMRRRTFIAGGVVAAAAAVTMVLVAAPPSSPNRGQPVYREESVTTFAAPRLLTPLGSVSAFTAFEWTSVPRADRYRVTVYTRDGAVMWEALTRDTVITPPDLIRRPAVDTVLWRVAAHVGWEDRWMASDLSIVTVLHGR